MSEPKVMKDLHSIRQKNYERIGKLPMQDQMKEIRAEAEPVRKRLMQKMKKAHSLTQS